MGGHDSRFRMLEGGALFRATEGRMCSKQRSRLGEILLAVTAVGPWEKLPKDAVQSLSLESPRRGWQVSLGWISSSAPCVCAGA